MRWWGAVPKSEQAWLCSGCCGRGCALFLRGDTSSHAGAVTVGGYSPRRLRVARPRASTVRMVAPPMARRRSSEVQSSWVRAQRVGGSSGGSGSSEGSGEAREARRRSSVLGSRCSYWSFHSVHCSHQERSSNSVCRAARTSVSSSRYRCRARENQHQPGFSSRVQMRERKLN